ncbi:hypothetical protein BN136_3492 [Cronobacter universalis NCTC 9529]|nr:hypothetical protein BN136_3492 [Cronobacter universalis NCTC 9529]
MRLNDDIFTTMVKYLAALMNLFVYSFYLKHRFKASQKALLLI